MLVDIGEGMVTLLGSVVTTVGGVVVLIITQRAGFKKAKMERDFAHQESVEQQAKLALELARKNDEVAAQVAVQVSTVSAKVEKVDSKIQEQSKVIEVIHQLSSGERAAMFAQLQSMHGQVIGLTRARRRTDDAPLGNVAAVPAPAAQATDAESPNNTDAAQ